MKGYMVMEMWHVSEMVVIKVKWMSFWRHFGDPTIFLRPPYSVPKPSGNPKLNQEWISSHHGYLGNGKARLKPLSNWQNPMPMIANEPNKQMHVPCIHTSTRKLHVQPITCKILMLNLSIQSSPYSPLLSFSFSLLLDLPLSLSL